MRFWAKLKKIIKNCPKPLDIHLKLCYNIDKKKEKEIKNYGKPHDKKRLLRTVAHHH